MGIGCKRSIVGLGLVLLSAGLVAYWYAGTIVEGLLASSLEARGGTLDVAFIRLRAQGLEIEINHYEDPALRIDRLKGICSWGQLWKFGSGLSGRWHAEAVHIRLEADPEADAGPDLRPPAATAAMLAKQIESLPLRAITLAVDDLGVEHAGQAYRLELELSYLRSLAGDAQLTADLESEGLDLNLRARVLAGGAGLALDFVGSATGWEALSAAYFPALMDQLADHRSTLYLDRLGEERGFLDLSGHVRWAESRSNELDFTLLANLGASEFYFENGECVLQAASFGLASGGLGSLRAYARGAVESVRYGSWMQSGGDWALRVDGPQTAAEIRLGEGLSISLGHEDWQQALAGAGKLRAYLKADELGAEILSSLKIAALPADLVLDMDLQMEGHGILKNFGLESAVIEADADIRRAASSSRQIEVKELQAKARANVGQAGMELESLAIDLEAVQAAGFTIGEMAPITAEQTEGGYALSSLEASFMGGRLRMEPTTIDPAKLESLSLRASVESIELPQLAKAIPQFKGEISGTLSGHLVAGWRKGQVILEDGQLEVDSGSGARLRYEVDGLLTRGISPGTAAYARYRMAEKAFADLELKRLQIEVFPEANPMRPFRMELSGESEQDGLIVPIDFDLNVNVDDTAGLLEILQLMRQGELRLE